MIARHLHSANSKKPTEDGRPKAIDSDEEKKHTQFCLIWQFEKNPVTVQDFIDFMHDNRVQVDRFWVRRFVERNSEILTLQQAQLLKKERHEISEHDLNRYFDAVTIHIQSVSSLFVWNADETRAGISKKHVIPEVIVTEQTRPGTITIAEEHNDSEITLLACISAFGYSISPLFISKSKIFEAERLAEQQLFHGRDYVMRSAEKTVITEVLFMDWLQTQFIP